MTTKIKICGIKTADDYIACRDAGATFVGMVYYPGSSRHLDLASLANLAACSAATNSNTLSRVLLTVDMHVDDLVPLVEAGCPDLIQLHGNETPEDVTEIKTHFGLPIIKSIGIVQPNDLDQCGRWHGVVDWLLFDAKVRPGAQPGGTGHSFDWSILRDYKGGLPWMLAGGLSKTNVAEAIKISGATAVDVSSGVELLPGKKDARQIHSFIRAAQSV